MTELRKKRIRLSPACASAWTDLQRALEAAAQPVTGMPRFAISPDCGYMIPGLSAEADRVLKEHPRTEVHHSFKIVNGWTFENPMIEHDLRWRE